MCWKKSKHTERKRKMTINEFCKQYSEEPIIVADGFDSAFMGIANVNGHNVAVYDELECIRSLRKDGMSGSEAREYFDFNVAGSNIGEKTPIYVTKYRKPKLDK